MTIKFKVWRSTETNSEDKAVIILGSGAFGVVAQGVLNLGFDELTGVPVMKTVAIKTPRIGITIEQIRSVLAEIKINLFVGRHKHIVEFLGFCITEIRRGKVSIILELCENGSLLKYLRDHATQFEGRDAISSSGNYENTTLFGNITLVRWCKEIAEGMEFLAGNNVLHGDLAARNCLLDSQLSIKISDFGLSRKLYDYRNYVKRSKAPLPWRWMALESLKAFEFSVKSDVWSYGVTIWEIFSLGDQPYPTLTWNEAFIQALSSGLRPPRPNGCPDVCYALTNSCWENDPASRPEFSEIIHLIGQELEKMVPDGQIGVECEYEEVR
ncbi:tyrosine-protein kinase receptor torso [Folsomia candida]|uniref:tyrosine-protein kinase receptor torso n=1 Tax=Folsomia candida TaxID=158441 RepID=UPI001605490B|nr:tyrosine-protein kinase receptor torso [Folsomia candida]